MGYKDNFWDKAVYRQDPDAPEEPFWWMPMDPRGPQPMHMLNWSTKVEDEKRERDKFLEIVLDYAW